MLADATGFVYRGFRPSRGAVNGDIIRMMVLVVTCDGTVPGSHCPANEGPRSKNRYRGVTHRHAKKNKGRTRKTVMKDPSLSLQDTIPRYLGYLGC